MFQQFAWIAGPGAPNFVQPTHTPPNPGEPEAIELVFKGNFARGTTVDNALWTVHSRLRGSQFFWLKPRSSLKEWQFDIDLYRSFDVLPESFAGVSGVATIEPHVDETRGEHGSTFVATFRTSIGEFAPSAQRIFLSHKGTNKPMVRSFKAVLERLGFQTWMDEDAMHAGAILERGLLDGFKKSCAVVFFITPDFVDTKYLADELDYAVSERREKGSRFAIIPIVFTDKQGRKGTVPELLQRYVYKHPRNKLDALTAILNGLPITAGPVRWKQAT